MRVKEERMCLALLEEVWPLLELHEKELNIFGRELDPDPMLYLKAGNTGAFKAYVMRDEDNTIVGYAAYWISRHPHYEIKTATQDVLFLEKKYRKGRNGIKLIRESEKLLKEFGVEIVTQYTKTFQPLDKLFTFLKYKKIEHVYAKEL